MLTNPKLMLPFQMARMGYKAGGGLWLGELMLVGKSHLGRPANPGRDFHLFMKKMALLLKATMVPVVDFLKQLFAFR